MKVHILKNPDTGIMSLYFPETQQIVDNGGSLEEMSIKKLNEFICMLEDNDFSGEQMMLDYQKKLGTILYPKRVRSRVLALISEVEHELNSKTDLSIDFCECIDLEELISEENDPDSLFDTISDELMDKGAFNHEVIYYAAAMRYLMEEDPSLHESLEIAEEFGFPLSKLSSEILASLLNSRRAQEEWHENSSEIKSILEQLIEDYRLAKAKDLIEEAFDWEIAEMIDDIWMDLEEIESEVTYNQYLFIEGTLKSFQ